MLDVDVDQPCALIDFPDQDGQRRRHAFRAPRCWLVAHDPSQVAALLDAAHEHSRQGRWCVGWVAYEAAPGLAPHLPVKALPPGTPYAVWAVFDEAEPWPTPIEADGPGWHLGPWERELSTPDLHRQIGLIHELIRAGEVYQINLTSRLHAAFEASPRERTAALIHCFAALQRSQPRGYSLMLDQRAACRAPGAVLSVSPELFFDWDGERIVTRPMKGTAARGATPEADDQARARLQSSQKERAENLMIVDLLRNDLSRIAEVGSVAVPALFEVEPLPTVWQMTSTITARTHPGTRLSEVFSALFPCGSVTGAPKRQAMHHIARLERSARGVYCGAAGLMAPGGRVTLNVPIRTVTVATPPPPAPWRASCGIGSGITLDATAQGESSEWLAKQAFLDRATQPFDLLESLRLDNGQFARVDLHLDRLARSAAHFGHSWDAQDSPLQVREALAGIAAAHPHGQFKVRLLWSAAGNLQVQASPLTGPVGAEGPAHEQAQGAAALVQLAPEPLPAGGGTEFLRYKTTHRVAYAPFAPPPGVLDTLLFTHQGELTEFTIGNLALCLGGRWYTPPASGHLLPGVMRAWLLSQGVLSERRLHLDDLQAAQGMALLNSVRGWLPVTLAPRPDAP